MEDSIQDGKLTSGSHLSFWTDSVKPLSFQQLKENLQTDVVVVGGGIAGLSVAYCLLKSGKKVVLVEDGLIGSGETGRTTAHLVTALDDRYYNLQRLYGVSGSRLAAQSHAAAIDLVENICSNENIDCDFERINGYLFMHPSDQEENITREAEAASNAGVEVTELNGVPGMMHYNGNCIRFANQAQFHPMKYLNGLCNAIVKSGGKVFTETHAKEINHTGIVTDEGFRVQADFVVIATNSPVNDKYAMHMKQFPYRTYTIGALVKKGSLPRALWWDTGDFEVNAKIPPYHYVRLQAYDETHDLLLSGGEDHPTGLADADGVSEADRYLNLEAWTRLHFPIEKIVYRWSGQVLEPMDSLAFIGRNPWDKDNVYIVTGDSGNGMTHGTLAGMLITDLISGKENKWEKLYNPGRVKFLKASSTFFKEFMGGLLGYLKTSPGDADSVKLSSIPKGEGRIIELRKEKYGAYRDENDQLHLVTAECTHLKCIVKWNNDEKSWDCPCHGSRFSYEGKTLNGPANKDLQSFSESQVTEHH